MYVYGVIDGWYAATPYKSCRCTYSYKLQTQSGDPIEHTRTVASRRRLRPGPVVRGSQAATGHHLNSQA
jgi:hypothetical protein